MSRPKRETPKLRRVGSLKEVIDGEVGDFIWRKASQFAVGEDLTEVRELVVRLPDPAGLTKIPVSTAPRGKVGDDSVSGRWWWDGDEEAPTLDPSVKVSVEKVRSLEVRNLSGAGGGTREVLWHGWIKGGALT